MSKKLAFVLSAMILGFTGYAVADEGSAPSGTTVAAAGSTKVPGVRKRARRQHKRIKKGIKSGQLTKDEVKDLRQEGKDIKNEVKDAKSDGKVTKEERVQIHKDLNKRSKDIYEKKHNDVTQ